MYTSVLIEYVGTTRMKATTIHSFKLSLENYFKAITGMMF